MATTATFALLVSFLLPHSAVPTQDPVKDLKSKDFETRKAAVLALTENPNEDAGKLLTKALKDEDWEIIELSAIGLGKIGAAAGPTAAKALVTLALEGPIRRIRREAARALQSVGSAEAIEEFSKKLSSKFAEPASEAIVELGAPEEARKAPKSLQKAAKKGKEYNERRSAAMALLIVGAKDRTENLAELLKHDETGVHSAALDAVRIEPATTDIGPIREFLLRTGLPNVNERRGIWALRAALWINDESGAREAEAKTLFEAFLAAKSDEVARRGPVLLEALLSPPQDTYGMYTHGETKKFPVDWVLATIAPALRHNSPVVRSAAVHALGKIGTEESRALAREHGSKDSDAHVRRTALAAALITLEEKSTSEEEDDASAKNAILYDDETAAWLVERLGAESDKRTREDLCVALGTKNFKAAIAPLAKAMGDDDPWVAVCAAVSLGKTRLVDCLIPLQGLLTHEDWRLRGAGVVGLGQSWQKGAIESLIAAVEDPVPAVAKAAHDYLIAYSNTRSTEQTKEAWEAWWKAKQESLALVDPETAEERSKKYGYSTNWDQIYGGLDIVVLNSRGDHIQNILARLGVAHRLTQGAQVPQSGLHPQAVYVSNCTGEVEAPDLEHLAWFLRCGGYLFGSCWSLHETIERVYPGVVKKYETLGDVLDLVSADNCAQGSPYTEGVFLPGVQPFYSLEGAHLIEVLDKERAEVLIDSPECAERWGSGDMAVWFPAGHGVVLDSVNHFEEQGFAHAKGLKKPEELQAYAMDHLGLSYEDLRATRDEKYWKSPTKAANEVMDLSVFKLITNFVRLKRFYGH